MLFDELQFEIEESKAYATIPPEYGSEEVKEEILLLDAIEFEIGELEKAQIPPEQDRPELSDVEEIMLWVEMQFEIGKWELEMNPMIPTEYAWDEEEEEEIVLFDEEQFITEEFNWENPKTPPE